MLRSRHRDVHRHAQEVCHRCSLLRLLAGLRHVDKEQTALTGSAGF